MYYFNPDNFGFYLSKGKGLIAITDEVYRDLINGQSEGNAIVIGGDGLPTLKPIEITSEEAVSAAVVQRDSLLRIAALRIAPLQYAVDLGIATQADEENLNLWKQFSVDVNRVPSQPKYPATITWPTPPGE